MDRRKFLRGSGMIATISAGLILGYRQYNNKPIIDKRVLDQVTNGNNCLTIQAGYEEIKPPPVTPVVNKFVPDYDGEIGQYTISTSNMHSGFFMIQNPKYKINSEVSLKPGPDGNLYIKINNEWKQVLTS